MTYHRELIESFKKLNDKLNILWINIGVDKRHKSCCLRHYVEGFHIIRLFSQIILNAIAIQENNTYILSNYKTAMAALDYADIQIQGDNTWSVCRLQPKVPSGELSGVPTTVNSLRVSNSWTTSSMVCGLIPEYTRLTNCAVSATMLKLFMLSGCSLK